MNPEGRKPGRPRGATKAVVRQRESASLLDKRLHELLVEGGDPVVDKSGKVQLDGEGKVIRRRLSAAMLQVIRARVRDVSGRGGRDRRRESLAEAAASRGFRFDGAQVRPIPPIPD